MTNSSQTPVSTSAHAVDLPCQTCDTGAAPPSQNFSCRDFRGALGRFATGVTIVTALATDGRPIGVTVSSFNSVSLDPPLILWSLSLNSPNLAAFQAASHYAINVLSSGQQDLSNRFAARIPDRFSDVPLSTGLGGVPLLKNCCAWFECTSEAHYPGGDHLIFVGRVARFAEEGEQSPLIFYNGRYAQLESPAPSGETS